MELSTSHTFDDQIVIPKLGAQLGLQLGSNSETALPEGNYFNCEDPDLLGTADHIVINMSGKDSLYALLKLIDMGVSTSKMQIWHQCIDGLHGDNFMDWPFTESFIEALGAHFNIPVYFQWQDGGFYRELMKENDISAPTLFQSVDGEIITIERDPKRSKPNTRRRFPQQAADLRTRWCSSFLKIEAAAHAIRKQSIFDGTQTIMITGERREESGNRARYNQLEHHSTRAMKRLGRDVWSWRTSLNASEEDVWAMLEKHQVLAPVPYHFMSRTSCRTCIFAGKNTLATLRHYWPDAVHRVADLEREFGTTISRNKISLLDLSDQGTPMICEDPRIIAQASATEYTLPIVANDEFKWTLPAGAFGTEQCGSL